MTHEPLLLRARTAEDLFSSKEAAALSRVPDDEKKWPAHVFSELCKEFPFMTQYDLEVVLDRLDPEAGAALGYVQVLNKTMSRPQDAATQAGNVLRVPIIIQDRRLQKFYIFEAGGQTYPLTEDRIQQAMLNPLVFDTDASRVPPSPGLLDQLYPPYQQRNGFGRVTEPAALGLSKLSSAPSKIASLVKEALTAQELQAREKAKRQPAADAAQQAAGAEAARGQAAQAAQREAAHARLGLDRGVMPAHTNGQSMSAMHAGGHYVAPATAAAPIATAPAAAPMATPQRPPVSLGGPSTAPTVVHRTPGPTDTFHVEPQSGVPAHVAPAQGTAQMADGGLRGRAAPAAAPPSIHSAPTRTAATVHTAPGAAPVPSAGVAAHASATAGAAGAEHAAPGTARTLASHLTPRNALLVTGGVAGVAGAGYLAHRYMQHRKAAAAKTAEHTPMPAPDAVTSALHPVLTALLALHQLYYFAHWTSQGEGFYGDHQLFTQLYEGVQADFDDIAERIVGHGGNQALDPSALFTQASAQNAQWMNGSASMFDAAFRAEQEFQAILQTTYDTLDQTGGLSLGIDDLLMAIASKHEKHQYMLKQRDNTVGATDPMPTQIQPAEQLQDPGAQVPAAPAPPPEQQMGVAEAPKTAGCSPAVQAAVARAKARHVAFQKNHPPSPGSPAVTGED